MRALRFALLLTFGAAVVGSGACTAAPAGRIAEPASEIEAQIAVALDMLRDLMQEQNRFKPSPVTPAELATVDRQMREFAAKQTAPGGTPEERRARLEKARETLLNVINQHAAEGARQRGLPAPKPTTSDTLREAVRARK